MIQDSASPAADGKPPLVIILDQPGSWHRRATTIGRYLAAGGWMLLGLALIATVIASLAPKASKSRAN